MGQLKLNNMLLPLVVTGALVVMPAWAESRTERTDAVLRAEMAERRIPGLQAAVIDHGHIVFLRAYGTADVGNKVPVTLDTVFPINSATKAFTGVACLKLAEEGKLDLNAPVSACLSDLPESWRGVTIRQLMTHMSGLPDIIDNTGATIEGGDEAAAWAKVKTLPLQFPAGEHFSYNQTNFALLERIIVQLTGKPFEALIADEAFKPAGMTHTEFGDSRSLAAGTAVSYHYIYPGADGTGDLDKVYEEYPPFMRSGAGINTSAQDLAHWLIQVEQGRFFKSPATLKTMWTPGTFNNGQNGPRALGWTTNGRVVHRAVGAEGGGRAAFAIYPDDDVAVIVLTNLAGANPEEMMDQIAVNYIPGMKLNGVTALRVALQARGFVDARTTFDGLKARDPEFEVAESDLNRWGYRLLGSNRAKDALEVFKLVVSLHPDSSNAYDSLAGGYEAVGNKALAIENYRRSLALDPGNSNGTERLKALGADKP